LFTDTLEASLDSTPALFNALTISKYVPKNIHNVAVDKLMVVRARSVLKSDHNVVKVAELPRGHEGYAQITLSFVAACLSIVCMIASHHPVIGLVEKQPGA
jgi:hypothetical protein